jgi:hypothetical protein
MVHRQHGGNLRHEDSLNGSNNSMLWKTPDKHNIRSFRHSRLHDLNIQPLDDTNLSIADGGAMRLYRSVSDGREAGQAGVYSPTRNRFRINVANVDTIVNLMHERSCSK